MGNRFDAYLAGRLATEPTLGTTQDGKPWAKFRLAVEDRARNDSTGEWEKAQTIFHDVVVFGTLAERTVGTLRTGDPVIAQGVPVPRLRGRRREHSHRDVVPRARPDSAGRTLGCRRAAQANRPGGPAARPASA